MTSHLGAMYEIASSANTGIFQIWSTFCRFRCLDNFLSHRSFIMVYLISVVSYQDYEYVNLLIWSGIRVDKNVQKDLNSLVNLYLRRVSFYVSYHPKRFI